ncbi:MAG TPA: hypothetical protein VMU36_03795 [Spirochaetia bacterium]|nr:hypothetical protein [Spirochaetia bacterium]
MSGSGRALVIAPAIAIAIAVLIPGMGFTTPPIASSIWASRLCVRDGVSDFGNRTFGELFRDAKFQEVITPKGEKITFALETRSVNGSDAVIDFIMKRNGLESERFSFSFRSMGAYTLLYRLSSDRGTVEGPDDLLKAMQRFYLPCLESY